MTAVDVSKGLMTRRQVMEFLSMSDREVRRLEAKGDLTVVRLAESSRPKYLRAEVEALVSAALERPAKSA